MSELKVYEAYICIHDFLPEEAPKYCEAIVSSNSRYAKDDWWDNAKEFECYLKSEADYEINKLQNKVADLLLRDKNMALNFNNVFNALARYKYKRCLDKAKWCERKRIDAADYRIPRKKWEFYDKWYKRWLELAEKFKPNKEAK